VRFGLALPHYDFSRPDGEPASWGSIASYAKRAEDLGFDSVWISDHFFLSLDRYGASGRVAGSAEPLTTLAAIAAVTERVRLGTLVLGAGFRHPALIAKAATTIDLVSGGRFDLGLGAGWYEEEFEAFGYEFGTTGERFSILEESVAVIASLFGEGPADFEGRHFRLEGAYNHPPAAQQPRPPIWVGGKGGRRLLRLVARHADGWNTVWAWSPEAYGERVEELKAVAAQEGRDPETVRLSVGLYTLVGEDERDLVTRYRDLQRWTPGGALDGELLDDWGRERLVGTPQQILARVEAFAGMGVEELIISAASLPFAVYEDSMLDLFAEAVIPEGRAL
jgi:probable F420-dependent oxidoreductase